jgi:hypothetical protein
MPVTVIRWQTGQPSTGAVLRVCQRMSSGATGRRTGPAAVTAGVDASAGPAARWRGRGAAVSAHGDGDIGVPHPQTDAQVHRVGDGGGQLGTRDDRIVGWVRRGVSVSGRCGVLSHWCHLRCGRGSGPRR